MSISTLDGTDALTMNPMPSPVAPACTDCASPICELPERAEADRVPLGTQIVTLLAVLLPFVGFVVAIVLLWGVALTWPLLAIFGLMYAATGLGITVGFHRLFTHRSFQTPRPVAFLYAVLGSMAVQGPLLKWVSTHRMHHQHSDKEDDPHSPHQHGRSIWGVVRGAWHSHIGWMFEPDPPGLDHYVQDLAGDRWLALASRWFGFWVLLGLLIPAALGGLFTGSWMGVLLGFIWGGLVRVFLVHHLTWSINSVCHIWGFKSFQSHDQSRNNFIFGVLAFGEGWHNNHHAFPTSARHGLSWWQLDVSYLVVRAMSLFGLARNIRVPRPERLEAKRVRPAA